MSYVSVVRGAGQLCTIKYESSQVGAGGKLTKEWRERAKDVQCYATALSAGEESMYFDRPTSTSRVKFIVLYSNVQDVKGRDRVFFSGKVYDIKAVVNMAERNLYYKIIAEEIKTFND